MSLKTEKSESNKSWYFSKQKDKITKILSLSFYKGNNIIEA